MYNYVHMRVKVKQLTQVGPPDDEHLLLETCRGMK
jgi:hypothetical protein